MSANDTHIQATLNYIDKVYAEQARIGTAINRTALVALTISALQLLAAVGWVSTKGDVSLLGLGVKATFVVLLLCSMVTLACLMAYYRALALRGYVMYMEICRLYKTVGYGYDREGRAMEDTLASPFRSVVFTRALAAQHLSKLYRPSSSQERAYAKYTSYIVRPLVLGTPTLAEIGGTVKLAYIIRWQNLWWVPTLALAFATAFTALTSTSQTVLRPTKGPPLE
jgi:hypothetical protein